MPDTPRSDPPNLLDYSNATHHWKRPPRKTFGWLLLVIAGATVLLVAFVVPHSGGRAHEGANRRKCVLNLRQIGIACLSYATSNAGVLPDSLATLHAAGQIEPEIYLCPSSNDIRAAGTRIEIEAILATSPPPGSPGGGCISYYYVGKGLTQSSPAGAVVAYEPVANHSSEGGHVLYLDGKVRWHDAKSLAKIIAALNAGQNPPP